MDYIIGLDITEDANVPAAVCHGCANGYAGEEIKSGDEWGGDACRCADCGIDIPVTLVPRR